jgi:hypothetical protein
MWSVRKFVSLFILPFLFTQSNAKTPAEKQLETQLRQKLAQYAAKQVPDPPDKIRFANIIDHNSVKKFKSKHAKSSASTVILVSRGGDVDAAIDLANWILDREMNIEVQSVCFSACANYLFLAGKKKIIGDLAVVLWHGGMHQKDLREKYLNYKQSTEPLLQNPRLLGGSKVNQRSAKDDSVFFSEYIRVRTKEDAFMKRVGVDEYLFRLGQEPTWYEPDCWSASIGVLEKLGVKGIESSLDFGTPDRVLGNPVSHFVCGGQPVTFKLDGVGAVVVDQ